MADRIYLLVMSRLRNEVNDRRAEIELVDALDSFYLVHKIYCLDCSARDMIIRLDNQLKGYI